MKKIYNEITAWTGWFFCEVAFKIFNLSRFSWLESTKRDAFVWWFRPVGWVADRSYNIGSWFYNLELEED